MTNHSALDILRDALKKMGADGLCTDDCGCELGDMAPCGNYFGACEPARRASRAEARDCGITGWEDCGQIMIPLDAKPLPKKPCDHCGKEWIEDDLTWTGTRHLCPLCHGETWK